MSLDGLPDAPAAEVFDFRAGWILDFAPFDDRHADSCAEPVEVKNFAEGDTAGFAAYVGWSERTNDGHSLGDHGEVDEIALIETCQRGMEGDSEIRQSSRRS